MTTFHYANKKTMAIAAAFAAAAVFGISAATANEDTDWQRRIVEACGKGDRIEVFNDRRSYDRRNPVTGNLPSSEITWTTRCEGEKNAPPQHR